MVRRADGMRPICVMVVVRPKLGLKCDAVARTVTAAVFGVDIAEPVAGIQMRARCGYEDVERAARVWILQAQCVARVGVGGKAIQAETMVKAPCNLELLVVRLDVAAERLGCAEIEWRTGHGAEPRQKRRCPGAGGGKPRRR